MKIILSPAKSMNEEVECKNVSTTDPVFPEETEKLSAKLAKLSSRQIKKLMGVSDSIAELNYQRFQNWNSLNKDRFKPAGYLFQGAAYQALNFQQLNQKEQVRGQEKLRILSGLYGLLKPLDLIQPYRLEMGTSFKVTPKMTNLYKFWGDKIRIELEKELSEDKTPILVNVASSEYFKAAELDKLKHGQIITPVFKDEAKDGSYKVNMQFAKLARGAMTRYIIKNNIDSLEGVKAFTELNYRFDPSESNEEEYVYKRDLNQRVLPSF